MAKFLDNIKSAMFGGNEGQYDGYDDGYDDYDGYDDGYDDQISYSGNSGYYDTASYGSDYDSYDDTDYSSSRSKSSQRKGFKSYVGGKSKSASKTSRAEYAEPEKDWNMIIEAPTSFDDSAKISGYIKEGKAVVVNFEKVSIKEAQRIMDFLSGTCCSLGGDIKKVGGNIYVISPINVGVRAIVEEDERRYSSGYEGMQRLSYGR
ncbi:cell division protein SepF [Chakrabartyella piscis]|uniref:cell division protein SepF n=1 Tax=Chakrabartyella piscis TaxID=2918914 RepID=UPI002958AE7E|nr:cell division protein SepF [Chakrabartyella piscis]